MFNWVKFEAPCSKCGKILDKFQTKSSEDELMCEMVKPETCTTFYDSCDDCKTWNEYKVIKKPLSIEFELQTQQTNNI